jgi:hypothetical protein
MENTIDWEHIRVAFAEPFNPADVDFRVQGNPSANGKSQVVCYVDSRTVADRLDAVVGPGAWTFDYTPLAVDAKGVVLSAKGILTIHGVSKSDIGDASNFEASKGTVSDALKRAAVLWGIGRYLYSVEAQWVPADKGRIAPDVIASLRTKLPRPASAKPVAQVAPATQAVQQAPAAQQPRTPAAKPATKAAPQTAATAAQGGALRVWTPLRLRARQLGYESVEEWETLVKDRTGKVSGPYTKADADAVDTFLASKEDYLATHAAASAERVEATA